MVWASRNIVQSGVLQKLQKHADVHILLRLPNPELEDLCTRQGAKVWVYPSHLNFNGVYTRVNYVLNQSHKARLNCISEKFKWQRRLRQLSQFAQMYQLGKQKLFALLGRTDILYYSIQQLERSLFYFVYKCNVAELTNYLQKNNIQKVLLTSPLQDNWEALLSRACSAAQIPMIGMILGFDNLTTKGRFYELADKYLVWNEQMKKELITYYPEINESQIYVTGSPQFDFYAGSFWGHSRQHFCNLVGIRPDKPFVLYAANTPDIMPYEHLLVDDLIKRMRTSRLLSDTTVVVRLHPYDTCPERWEKFKHYSGVVITTPWKNNGDPSWGFVTEDDIHLLCGSIKHSACVINICSTMSLDAVFCDRPVVAPAYSVGKDDGFSSSVLQYYQQEHFLPIATSDAIVITKTPEETVSEIEDALITPGRRTEQRKRLTSIMLGRPIGKSAESIVSILLDGMGSK